MLWIVEVVLLLILGIIVIAWGIALFKDDSIFFMLLAVIVGLGIVSLSYLVVYRAGCGNPVLPDSLDRKAIYTFTGKAELGSGKRIVVLKDGEENITCVITSAILPDKTEYVRAAEL